MKTPQYFLEGKGVRLIKKYFYLSCLFFIMFAIGILYSNTNDIFQEVEQAIVAASAESYGVFEGDLALPFTLIDDKGKEVNLKDLRGKRVIVNFFASWCPPCQEEMPLLVELERQMNPDNEILLGLNMTSQEKSVEDVRSFMKYYKAEYPVVYDKEGKVMKDYRIIGIPTTLVIDKNGRIERRINGMITKEMLGNLISE